MALGIEALAPHLEPWAGRNLEMLDEESCWQAVKERDSSKDDHFFFGVKTTGVFCRPSCSARRPLRKNVAFFPSSRDALRAGLRPCRRCHPMGRSADPKVLKIRDLCEYIQSHAELGDSLTLGALGQQANMTPSQLRRAFSKILGITPRQYVQACRFGAFKKGLKRGEAVTDAIYDAGFGSSSRVYEKVHGELGMTPTDYRSGGKGLEVSYAFGETHLGALLVAATDRGLCFAQFGDSEPALLEGLREELPKASLSPMDPQGEAPLADWMEALEDHLQGKEPHPDLPLDLQASAFRLQVWAYLRSIPYGETRSYAEVAKGIGKPRAVRAVATACARNPVALAIPCHRVIRSTGELGGYRWGLERKEALLAKEGGSADAGSH